MNYSGRYPGLFGGATQGKRLSDKPIEVPPPPPTEPIPNPPIEEDPPVILDGNSVLANDVINTEALAQELADDYTVAELKEMATDLGIEFKSGIRELALATLIAEYKLKEVQNGSSQ